MKNTLTTIALALTALSSPEYCHAQIWADADQDQKVSTGYASMLIAYNQHEPGSPNAGGPPSKQLLNAPGSRSVSVDTNNSRIDGTAFPQDKTIVSCVVFSEINPPSNPYVMGLIASHYPFGKATPEHACAAIAGTIDSGHTKLSRTLIDGGTIQNWTFEYVVTFDYCNYKQDDAMKSKTTVKVGNGTVTREWDDQKNEWVFDFMGLKYKEPSDFSRTTENKSFIFYVNATVLGAPHELQILHNQGESGGLTIATIGGEKGFMSSEGAYIFLADVSPTL